MRGCECVYICIYLYVCFKVCMWGVFIKYILMCVCGLCAVMKYV